MTAQQLWQVKSKSKGPVAPASWDYNGSLLETAQKHKTDFENLFITVIENGRDWGLELCVLILGTGHFWGTSLLVLL
jgi:hypothetical protein